MMKPRETFEIDLKNLESVINYVMENADLATDSERADIGRMAEILRTLAARQECMEAK
jgi:division protein CdvB (Snf7/Vps24/ESCRT-III family)